MIVGQWAASGAPGRKLEGVRMEARRARFTTAVPLGGAREPLGLTLHRNVNLRGSRLHSGACWGTQRSWVVTGFSYPASYLHPHLQSP